VQDPKSIENAVKNLEGSEKLISGKEFKALPKILLNHELPENFIRVTYKNRNGLLIATNERLIFISTNLFGSKTSIFPYENILSIQNKTGSSLNEMEINTHDNEANIIISKDQLQPFVDWLSSKIAQKSKELLLNEILRLAELCKNGGITHKEFLEQKLRLLEQDIIKE